MALSYTVFDVFDLEKYSDFDIRVRGHSRLSKLCHSIACLWIPVSVPVRETLSVKCLISSVTAVLKPCDASLGVVFAAISRYISETT